MADLQLNAPGVPALLGGVNISLPAPLIADTVVGYGIINPRPWGIYLDGVAALTFESFLSVDYRRGWALSDFPVERGGFQTYDKVQLPFDVRVKLATGGSIEDRVAMIESIEQVAGSLLLYDVVTPEQVFTSVNVQHIDYHRTATNGVGLLVVEIWLLEVRVNVVDGTDNTGANNQPVDAAGNDVTQQTGTADGINGAANSVVDPSGANPVTTGSVAPDSTPLDPGQIFSFPGAF